MTPTKLDHALAIAALGFSVFPLTPGKKKPLIDNWPNEATADADRIRQWWEENPHANIGVTGEDLIIVDVDEKDGRCGGRALMALELQHDDLPPTLTSRTPTGGRHIFLRTPQPIANSVQKIGQGLDIRGRGGYVVAPGSTIAGKEYRWESEPRKTPIAQAPEWLLTIAGAARDKQRDQHRVGELDTEQAIQKATAMLRAAEPAVQGDGGDIATFKLAARILDIGISEPQALDLMLEHWNERCSPPWTPQELEQKIENAARYRQEPIGSKNAEAEFEPVTDQEIINQKPVNDIKRQIGAKAIAPFDENDLEPPEWQWGQLAAKRYVSLHIADPGVGKTNLMLALAVAKATGRDDIVGPVHGKGKAWFISGEDGTDDLKRRLAGVMKLHNVSWMDIEDHLFINSGQDERIRIATLQDGKTVVQVDAKAIAEEAKAKGIDLLILDPLVEFHTANENDNNQMAEVAGYVRRIAWDANLAAVLVHHSRKRDKASSDGQEGDQDSARGARAVTGVGRVVFTLTHMSEKRAKEYGIGDQARRRYIGVDVAKNNLAPRGDTIWFEQVGVDVGTKGLQVGTVQMASLERAPASDGADTALMALVVDGFLSTVGEGKWTNLKPVVEHVMAHDAFWRGREESGVRKHVRRVIETAIETGADPTGAWLVGRCGETTREVLYCIRPVAEKSENVAK